MTRDEALDSIPVKHKDVGSQRPDDGDILLTYPLSPSPWLVSLARRFPGATPDGRMERKLQLDEMGTAVWELMDGERSARQIAEAFARKYQVQVREAETAVTRFLRELGRRGLIGIR